MNNSNSLINLFIYCNTIISLVTCSFIFLSQHPVHALLLLILLFIFVPILLCVHNLLFFSLVYVIIYAGAIFVLFLFVVMMTNLRRIYIFAEKTLSSDWHTSFTLHIAPIILNVLFAFAATVCTNPDANYEHVFKDSIPYRCTDVLVLVAVFRYNYVLVLAGVLLTLAFIGVTIIAGDFKTISTGRSNNVHYNRKIVENHVSMYSTRNI